MTDETSTAAWPGSSAAPFVGAGPWRTDEVTDGNLNVVYRVTGAERSVIVKHAPPYLRVVGDGWPLTQDRVRIEAQALQLHGELAPGRGPTVLGVHLDHAAIVLEDLADTRCGARAWSMGATSRASLNRSASTAPEPCSEPATS